MTGFREHFIARQAILDGSHEIYAYELFFRTGLQNFFPDVDGDMASKQVISDSFLVFGIDHLTGPARAFVNFGRELLVQGRPRILPPEKVVVEVLETVDPDPEVIAACRALKDEGFTIALDDFVLRPDYAPLMELADIIKVDFRQTPAQERAALTRKLRSTGITLLAEKVETPQEFQEGLESGYRLFQGYFFSRPTVESRREVEPQQAQYLRLLKEINMPDLDFGDLTRLIQTDVSLSLKLLRYVNASSFGLRRTIASIKEALILLGETEVRRWANLIALSELASGKPAEILRLALVRARMGELSAPLAGMHNRSSDLFLLGLFSLLDAMLDRPLAEILGELPLAQDLKSALLGEPNRLGALLSLCVAQERGDWEAMSSIASRLGIAEDALPEIQVKALRFPEEIAI